MFSKIVAICSFDICRVSSVQVNIFSEALILASPNPQYDKKLFIELPVQHMKTTSAEHGQNMARTCSTHVLRS